MDDNIRKLVVGPKVVSLDVVRDAVKKPGGYGGDGRPPGWRDMVVDGQTEMLMGSAIFWTAWCKVGIGFYAAAAENMGRSGPSLPASRPSRDGGSAKIMTHERFAGDSQAPDLII